MEILSTLGEQGWAVRPCPVGANTPEMHPRSTSIRCRNASRDPHDDFAHTTPHARFGCCPGRVYPQRGTCGGGRRFDIRCGTSSESCTREYERSTGRSILHRCNPFSDCRSRMRGSNRPPAPPPLGSDRGTRLGGLPDTRPGNRLVYRRIDHRAVLCYRLADTRSRDLLPAVFPWAVFNRRVVANPLYPEGRGRRVHKVR